MAALLTPAAVESALARLPGWIADSTGLERTMSFGTFPLAIEAVNRVAEVAEKMNHHPDIDIRWRTVRSRLTTHTTGGITTQDVELAEALQILLDGA
ncbi:4a-hydroxytetrahydrobiopterin dehydratase [Amycolatopsis sp. 3B14]|uniref:4a-hydroxytetrahydrobiopterin dehydratase n=1 Tax=Amycolatopsis sp. 3B14 TaxID=3243600 RepID=UPI003D9893E7